VAKYLVQKSNPLDGEVTISGSKNAVLPIMAASILTKGKCELFEVPALRDVDAMAKLKELSIYIDSSFVNLTMEF